MKKFKVNVPTYPNGYLRCGHYEGTIEAETIDEVKKILQEDIDILDFKLDDYELNDNDVQFDQMKIEEVIENE